MKYCNISLEKFIVPFDMGKLDLLKKASLMVGKHHLMTTLTLLLLQKSNQIEARKHLLTPFYHWFKTYLLREKKLGWGLYWKHLFLLNLFLVLFSFDLFSIFCLSLLFFLLWFNFSAEYWYDHYISEIKLGFSEH